MRLVFGEEGPAGGASALASGGVDVAKLVAALDEDADDGLVSHIVETAVGA